MKQRSFLLFLCGISLRIINFSVAAIETPATIEDAGTLHRPPPYYHFGDLEKVSAKDLKRKGVMEEDHEHLTSSADPWFRPRKRPSSPSPTNGNRNIGTSFIETGGQPSYNHFPSWGPETDLSLGRSVKHQSQPSAQTDTILYPSVERDSPRKLSEDVLVQFFGSPSPNPIMEQHQIQERNSLELRHMENSGGDFFFFVHPNVYHRIPQYVTQFIKDFGTSVDQMMIPVKHSSQPIGCLLVRLCEFLTDEYEQVSMMWVCNESGALIPQQKLKHSLGTMICCLFHSHQALIEKMEPLPTVKELHGVFFKWLHDEIFNPTQSLPVLGRTQFHDHPTQRFGEVQTILIQYLSMNLHYDYFEHLAIPILGIWYRTFHPKIWKQNWSNNSAFKSRIINGTIQFINRQDLVATNNAARRLTHARPPFWNVQGVREVPSCSLLDINQTDGEMSVKDIPRYHKTLSDENSLNIYLSKCQEFFISLNQSVKGRVRVTPIRDLPLGTTRMKPQDNTRAYLTMKCIRVIRPNHTLVTTADLIRMFKSLVKHIHFYHGALIRGLMKPELDGKYQGSLLGWLFNEIFSPSGSLPVIGIVDLGLNTDKFPVGALQIRLAKFLSGDETGDQSKLNAVAIIGMWYKNIHPEIWRDNWNNDGKFWNFMLTETTNFRSKIYFGYRSECTAITLPAQNKFK